MMVVVVVTTMMKFKIELKFSTAGNFKLNMTWN